MAAEELRKAAAGSLLEPDDSALSQDVSRFLQSLSDRYVLSTEWCSQELLKCTLSNTNIQIFMHNVQMYIQVHKYEIYI